MASLITCVNWMITGLLSWPTCLCFYSPVCCEYVQDVAPIIQPHGCRVRPRGRWAHARGGMATSTGTQTHRNVGLAFNCKLMTVYQSPVTSALLSSACLWILPTVLRVTRLSTKHSQKVYWPEVCNAGEHKLIILVAFSSCLSVSLYRSLYLVLSCICNS